MVIKKRKSITADAAEVCFVIASSYGRVIRFYVRIKLI
jgi:hypothetical protein